MLKCTLHEIKKEYFIFLSPPGDNFNVFVHFYWQVDFSVSGCWPVVDKVRNKRPMSFDRGDLKKACFRLTTDLGAFKGMNPGQSNPGERSTTKLLAR